MADNDIDDAEYEETRDEEDGDEFATPGASTNQLIRRGMDGVSTFHANAASQALVAEAQAEIQARCWLAAQNPRNLDQVRQVLMHECKRPKFAEVAVYEVPRGGKKITGLSIRFAEVAMRAMTNMSCNAKTIFDSTEQRLVRVAATDYETNTWWSRDITITKTIERKQLKQGQRALRERVNSYGDRVFIVEGTDDDIAVKEAAEISKKSRTAILRLIPGHLQDEALKLCNKVYLDKAAKDPDAEKNAVLDAFAEQNVLPEDLGRWLGHDFAQVTPAQLADLRRLFVAIREGHTSWPDALLEAEQKRIARKVSTSVPANAPTESKPAQSAAPTPAARTSSGKGAAAMKEKMKADQAGAPASAPAAAPAAKDDPPAGSQGGLDLARKPSGQTAMEERNCAGCGGPIEVPVDAPKGQECTACRNA